MEKFLQPNRFCTDPNTYDCDKKWIHWRKTFENFMGAIEELHPNKLSTLINYVEPMYMNLLVTVLLMITLCRH